MRFYRAFCLLVVTGEVLLLPYSTISALTTITTFQQSHRVVTSLRVGQGWDNEDFLSSLSGQQQDREEATEDYYRQSRFGKNLEKMPPPPPAAAVDEEIPMTGGTQGAIITEEMKQKIKEQNERDESHGGKMFKELLAKAEQAKAQQQSSPGASMSGFTVLPYQPNEAQLPQAPAPQASNSLENMSVEQQAEMFRIMMQQQQPPSGYGSPPKPPVPFPQAYPPQGAPLAADGRRIGRNRDADQIQNSADLYFAQLKRDSAIRKEAWLSGDMDRAAAVFEDPSIQEIKERVNPYLEERKRLDSSNQIETSEEERIKPEYLLPRKGNQNTDYTGVSYKEKMKQMREKSGGGGGVSAAGAPAQVRPVVAAAAAAPLQPPPVPVAPTVTPVKQAPVPSSSTPPTEEDKRSDIRTLMGLLLKHRGGPGFGAGRLQGNDVDLFASLSDVLVKVFKEEGVAIEEAVEMAQGASITMGDGAGGATTAKVNSLISVLDGAITMYRNSPPELKESVLATLRVALLSSVTTLNDIVGNNAPIGSDGRVSPSTGQETSEQRIDNLIACIEGACLMYKNSPPELQQPVLVTLRAALLSAVATLNSVISETELARQAPMQQTSPTTTTAAAAAPAEMASYSGQDENTQFFQDVYSKLKSASGEGKLGLRGDLTASEAADLADAIAEMRSRLVDELDQGIIE